MNFVFGTQFSEQLFDTHLRWNILASQDNLSIKKEGTKISIKTINLELFNSLVDSISKLNVNKNYFNKISFDKKQYPQSTANIIVDLKSSAVELFSFYKSDTKKQVLDFWVNEDLITKNASATQRTLPKTDNKTVIPQKVAVAPVKKVSEVAKKKIVKKIVKPSNYRDFRYGAAFIWNYKPLVPFLGKDLLLSSKIPEFLYPIQDRQLLDDPKEAHMQLSINFYRKKQWALMTKSIRLYTEKYGQDKSYLDNEYLKVNALMKRNIKDQSKGMKKSAITILNNIAGSTTNYELKKASLRFIIQDALDDKDYVKALKVAKQLYVSSTKIIDNEAIAHSIRVVLYTLAELNQVEKMKEFLQEKYVQINIPKQIGDAYWSYIKMRLAAEKDLIKDFEKKYSSYTKPVAGSILYNVAEAYFRNSEYKKAIKIYDEFVSSYTHYTAASNARLRIALSYDLLGAKISKVKKLYKNSINRSPNAEIRYEAKLRYIGLELNRKKKLSKADKEVEVFFEKSSAEKAIRNNDLQELLWVTRLRTFINSERYNEALTYLMSVPLESLSQVKKSSFIADGAEIILGIVKNHYNKGEYSDAVRIWELYKDEYEKKVARNPYINFIVTDSYLKLGLEKSFKRSLEEFENIEVSKKRNFPLWVQIGSGKVDSYINELKVLSLIKDNKIEQAENLLKSKSLSNRKYLYLGRISYNKKDYKSSLKAYERILTSISNKDMLSSVELKEVTEQYIKCAFEVKPMKKFQDIAKAIVVDLENGDNNVVIKAKEKVLYLLVESYFSSTDKVTKEARTWITKMMTEYPGSQYRHRLTYLKAMSFVTEKSLIKGKEVLNKLIGDKDAPSYLKEMARSELATIELKGQLKL